MAENVLNVTELSPEEQDFIRLGNIVLKLLPKIMLKVFAWGWENWHGETCSRDVLQNGNETSCDRSIPEHVTWQGSRV